MRQHFTFANVTSVVALFVALGGTSYAVATGAIGSREIRNNSVRGKDLRNSSITSRDVKRGALGGRAIRESRLGRVPRAATADRLGGRTAEELRVRCPQGTVRNSGVCVEASPRPAVAHGTAIIACESLGRRLPSYHELFGALDESGVAPALGGELTANVYPSSSDPGRLDALYVTSNVGAVGLTPDTFAGRKPFRCVADPSN